MSLRKRLVVVGNGMLNPLPWYAENCKPLVQEIIQAAGGDASASGSAPAPAALAGFPLGNPEVAGALKLLIREVVNWACTD